MKAIVNTAPGQLELRELPTPTPSAGQVRIRTGAVGICATDLEMIGGWERTGFPAIPGHEWSGTVDAIGPGVDEALLGRRCVAENVLADGGEVGFEHPGGYGEFLLTEAANVQPLPDDFSFATAALIEPLAVTVRALHRLGPVDGATLLLGDGPIGLMLTMLLARRGSGPIAVLGGREARLALATEFGASLTANYHTMGDDLLADVRAQLGSDFAVVIEASGSPRAFHAALELAACEGKMLMLGDYSTARAEFPLTHFLQREVVLIPTNASAGAWPEAVRLAVEDALPLDRLITHRLPADRFEEGMDLVRSRRGDVLKVILEWQPA
jgi:2-desacetyl-2-hydroxyethyl bacteriochlorophyllide A dehydrogenase